MHVVGIIMGSQSDFPVVEAAIKLLKDFEISVDVRVISAHRTPEEAAKYAKEALERGVEVIIAAAGKAAHLPGVLAAYTTLPVIGLPIKSSTMDGLDSLLSMVQMPSGVPVATVAINGSTNAALLAVQILALKDKSLRDSLKAYKDRMVRDVKEQDERIQKEVQKR
ncbi:MAG: 5-(carboxyamino)imidazole ribonucleotide mutase [Clostridia bacterium]|jgi:5-(carboxyamino)imidazole ribonucleotide mutase